MMQTLYYDQDARPVSWQRWRQLGRQSGYSRVGYADAIRYGRQVTVITGAASQLPAPDPDLPVLSPSGAGQGR
jgi:hypothetical protein